MRQLVNQAMTYNGGPASLIHLDLHGLTVTESPTDGTVQSAVGGAVDAVQTLSKALHGGEAHLHVYCMFLPHFFTLLHSQQK